MLSFVCVLVAVSSGTWLLVMRPAARQWLASSWLTSKLSKEQQEMRDALALAVSIIAAVTSTTVLLFILFVTIVHFFK